jgi:hypothetical protein
MDKFEITGQQIAEQDHYYQEQIGQLESGYQQ